MKKTRYLTFCAIMTALGIVVMLLGSFIQVLDLTSVIAASVFVFVTSEELGKSSIAVYVATSVISLLLLPSKLVALEYLILGMYPIIKKYFDKLPILIRNIVKLVYMIIVVCAILLLMNFIFTDGEAERHWYILFAFGVVGLVCFVVYDIALNRLAKLYRGKLRNQLRIDRFFK